MHATCHACGAQVALIYREELLATCGDDWASRQRWYFWQCMYCDATGTRGLEDVIDENLFGPANE